MSERTMREVHGIFCATCGKPIVYDSHNETANGNTIYFKCKNVLCDNHNHLPDNAKYDEIIKRGFVTKNVVIFE